MDSGVNDAPVPFIQVVPEVFGGGGGIFKGFVFGGSRSMWLVPSSSIFLWLIGAPSPSCVSDDPLHVIPRSSVAPWCGRGHFRHL
eukprot:6555693-Heterocapsa_arctica.AAC.1